MSKNYYITTPIYYVNDKPHIGHAYTSLACDVLARFKRMDGFNVHFLTGTDEHGQKIEQSAKKAGKGAQQFTDEVAEHFVEMAELMGLSHDDFIRTTQPRHKEYVAQVWQKIKGNGHIYLDKYSGWYSVSDEAFYAESELVDGKAPTGKDVEWVEEESYFFDLSKWQEKLLEFYNANPDFIAPEGRRNEVISFVKGGLKDLSISRTSFKWGVPVPSDQNHVMYVWLDALFNYISALEDKKDAFWPADLHMVGKDILRFHAIYWPAFLMAADLPLPKRVFAHGWWTIEGEKMSKSLGNVVAPSEMVEEFGLDATRYFLMREVPFGNDGNFSKDGVIERVNAELGNKVGNLAQRVLSMIYKNCDAKIPQILVDEYKEFLKIDEVFAAVKKRMDTQEFHLALEKIIGEATAANIFTDEHAPWNLKKEDPEKMAEILAVLAEKIRQIAILLLPFIPETAGKILDQLGQDARDFDALENYSCLSGESIEKPEGVFPRLEKKS